MRKLWYTNGMGEKKGNDKRKLDVNFRFSLMFLTHRIASTLENLIRIWNCVHIACNDHPRFQIRNGNRRHWGSWIKSELWLLLLIWFEHLDFWLDHTAITLRGWPKTVNSEGTNFSCWANSLKTKSHKWMSHESLAFFVLVYLEIRSKTFLRAYTPTTTSRAQWDFRMRNFSLLSLCHGESWKSLKVSLAKYAAAEDDEDENNSWEVKKLTTQQMELNK